MILGINIALTVGRKAVNNKQDAAPATEQNATQQNGSIPNTGVENQIATTPTTGLTIKKPTTVEAEQNGVRQFAKVYVERYGTFSSQNNFQNLKDLKGLSTDSLWQKIDALIKNAKQQVEFLGVTTKAITTNILNWSGDKAIVELKVTRTEERSSGTTDKIQTYTLNLIKTGQGWLVDKIVWK